MPSQRLARPGALRLPVLSFVVTRAGETDFGPIIEAIRAQDYPDVEAVLVEVGATETSEREIARLVAGDPRFKPVSCRQRLSPMAAARLGLDRTDGAFVVFLDTAVLPFPSFASLHVQAHLASRHIMAFTASRITTEETLAPLAVLTTCPEHGLFRANAAARLGSVGDAEFEALSAHSALLDPTAEGWTTSPGTTIVYRRHVLEPIHPIGEAATLDHLAVDAHYAGLAHLFGGSLAIDIPLTRMVGSSGRTPPDTSALAAQVGQRLCVWARQGRDLEGRIGERRYWQSIHVLLAPLSKRTDIATDTAYKGFLPRLAAAFGENKTIHRLNERVPRDAVRAMLQAEYGPRLPLRTFVAVRVSTFRSWHNRFRLYLRRHRRRLKGQAA